MPSQNEHTGDRLVTKVPSEAYKENYDKIFGKKQKTLDDVTPQEWDEAYQRWKERDKAK